MTKIERRDFIAELEKIDKECKEAIKAIFSHYGLKQLFLIDSYFIDEYNSINGISIENSYEGPRLRGWFFLHSEENGWFSPSFDNPWDHAAIYHLVAKTIDCLTAKNVPFTEWDDEEIVTGIGEELWYTVKYQKSSYEKGYMVQALSIKDAEEEFKRDFSDCNYSIISITKD